jgi:hypothetical protein
MNKAVCFSLVAAAILLMVAVPAIGADEKKPATATARAKMETLMLEVVGVQCANCAKVITKTLEGAGLEVVGTVRPNTTGPSNVEVKCPTECDLGAVAAKINKAETPHRTKVAPSLSLRLFAKLNAESAKTCMAACQKIEGLDAKMSKCDAKTGEMDLKTTGEKKVTAPEILLALKQAGIQAHTIRSGTTIGTAKSK